MSYEGPDGVKKYGSWKLRILCWEKEDSMHWDKDSLSVTLNLNLCYRDPLHCQRTSPKSPSLVPRYEEGQPLMSLFAV